MEDERRIPPRAWRAGFEGRTGFEEERARDFALVYVARGTCGCVGCGCRLCCRRRCCRSSLPTQLPDALRQPSRHDLSALSTALPPAFGPAFPLCLPPRSFFLALGFASSFLRLARDGASVQEGNSELCPLGSPLARERSLTDAKRRFWRIGNTSTIVKRQRVDLANYENSDFSRFFGSRKNVYRILGRGYVCTMLLNG
ncbi:hypothetical protein KM043_002760 [Ampulex compressa]|nr:hypothetical protein KM043_002760 [Ampulex compressa]